MKDLAYLDYYDARWRAYVLVEGKKWSLRLPPCCTRGEAIASLERRDFEVITISNRRD